VADCEKDSAEWYTVVEVDQDGIGSVHTLVRPIHNTAWPDSEAIQGIMPEG
jgi:hypothetical protein